VRRNIATTAVHHNPGVLDRSNGMFWTGFFIGFATCLAIGLTAHFVHDRRQRAAFIASLSPAERERFRGFEKIRGDWHEFRDLLHTHAREAPAENQLSGKCGNRALPGSNPGTRGH
jgi:hypothetical protein